jgi:hypothetical protein
VWVTGCGEGVGDLQLTCVRGDKWRYPRALLSDVDLAIAHPSTPAVQLSEGAPATVDQIGYAEPGAAARQGGGGVRRRVTEGARTGADTPAVVRPGDTRAPGGLRANG